MKPNKEITRLQELAGIKPLNESFDSLVHKLEKQGKSEEDAEKIAGDVNAKYVHHYREGVEEVDEIKVNNPNNGKILMDIVNIINNPFDNFELDDEDIMADALNNFEGDLNDLVEDTYGDDVFWEDIKLTPKFINQLKDLVKSYPEISPKLLPLF